MGTWIPHLVLQLMGNEVVSIGTTIDNANDGVLVVRKAKPAGVWSTQVEPRTKSDSNFNEYV